MAILGRILVYTKRVDEMVAFYASFGFVAKRLPGDRIVELIPQDGGATIMLHQAAKSQKQGQSQVKLVFDIPDVERFKAECEIAFGPVHKADGYVYSNTKDPSGNTVQISSRAYASNG